MTPRTLAPIGVLAVGLALAGCAAGHAVERPPSAAPSPGRAFAGECDRVIGADALAELVGPAAAVQASLPDSSAAGLACTWVGEVRTLTVTVMPAVDASASDITRFRIPECDPATGFCGGGIEAADMWIVVDFGWIEGEWEPVVTTALNAVARAAEAHG